MLVRRHYQKIRHATVVIQRAIRRTLQKRHEAATIIQAFARSWLARRFITRMNGAAVTIQVTLHTYPTLAYQASLDQFKAREGTLPIACYLQYRIYNLGQNLLPFFRQTLNDLVCLNWLFFTSRHGCVVIEFAVGLKVPKWSWCASVLEQPMSQLPNPWSFAIVRGQHLIGCWAARAWQSFMMFLSTSVSYGWFA